MMFNINVCISIAYDTVYNRGIIDNEMDYSDPQTVEVELICIIDNAAARGDGNCILFDGDAVTMDKISGGTSGTALAIAITINLIAVE